MTATQAQDDFSVKREFLFWLAFVAGVVGIFWPGLILGQIPAFRDSYHFYFPQAHWQIECAREGEWFPMWNQFEGLGTSVPGQGSSALYYPLRILLLLPALMSGISAAQAFSIFLATHIVIAAIGIRWAASCIAQSQAACWIAGMSFGLSCPVFFQQYNQIYLCSAVWMGFTLVAILNLEQQCKRLRQFGWACLWSLSIAAMLLAGDPHSAVNSVLVSLALGTLLSWKQRSLWMTGRFAGWISLGCVIAAVVTIPQWLPTLRWSQHCHRAGVRQIWPTDFAQERSISPEPQNTESPLLDEHSRLLAQLEQAKLSAPSVYEFSLAPWHVASMAFPTLGGQYLPTHSRWLDAWPAEGRMWIPSLFMGSATFLTVLLIGAKQRPEFLILGCMCLTLSFGNYSPSWLLREASLAFDNGSLASNLPSDQATALYEGLVKVIPGYAGFRYPAKWTTWFVALLCLSTAANVYKLTHADQESRTWRKLVVASLGAGCIAFGILLSTSSWQEWFDKSQPLDPLLGRCEASPTSISFLFAGCCSIAALAAWNLAAGRRFGLRFIAAYTLAELLCFSGITSCFTQPPIILSPSTVSSSGKPLAWTNLRYASVEEQTEDVSLVERQTQLQDQFLVGKLSVLAKSRSLSAVQSLEPEFAEKIRLSLNSLDNFSHSQPGLDELLASIGVTHRLARSELRPDDLEWIEVKSAKPLCELSPLGASEDLSSTLNWAWISQSRLEIKIVASHPCILLIRQFNDGGWIVERTEAPPTAGRRGSSATRSNGADENYFVPNRAPTPFMEIRIPAGRHQLAIFRRWLW